MQAIGFDLSSERTIHEVDVWTSHEGLSSTTRSR
jgi:3-deoxy-D-arabino-heptulosonate 7-phosphate (DAHP) synthase class II